MIFLTDENKGDDGQGFLVDDDFIEPADDDLIEGDNFDSEDDDDELFSDHKLDEEDSEISPEDAIAELDKISLEKVSNKASLIVPDDVLEKFSEYVDLIKKSESMNDEERQYWIDVLPTMEKSQLDNLKKILTNEREQLSIAEDSYDSDAQEGIKRFGIDFDENKYKEKKIILHKMESESEAKEERDEAELLKEIENMTI